MADLARQHALIRSELDEAVRDVVDRSAFIGGKVVQEFGEQFARYCGARFAIPCANGTEAMRLAILGVLGSGDGRAEILTVSHTFAATVEAIVAARYRPVLIDIDPRTYLMDLSQARAAVSSRTIAIVPVHLCGQMVDMRALREWARAHGLAVIEDAAQAHGAAHGSIRPGQLGDAASFSFFPGKNLGGWGDAGAVVTNDAQFATRIEQLMDHGRSDKFTHLRVGCNARMDAIQAAVLSVKLPYLEGWNARRREIAAQYDMMLGDVLDLIPPFKRPGTDHVYHQYVVRTRSRAKLQDALRQQGIATGVHYPIPVHEQPAFAFLGYKKLDLPQTHMACRSILSLPIFPEMTDEQVALVCDAIHTCFREPERVGA